MSNKTKVKITLSVVIATKNEELNIGACLDSIKNIADETIVFDEYSSDRTRKIAKNYGAKVYKYKHKTNFHETKQKAIEKATGDWILQLDADELVTPKLAEEIKEVINSSRKTLLDRVIVKNNQVNYNQLTTRYSKKLKLFHRHQQLIEKREGRLGKRTGEVDAFFIPRLNFFMGRPIKRAGVYPDGVIRLFKNGKARLPGRSVHELMEVEGGVGWLFNHLEHNESPTLKRYFKRMERYTNLHAQKLKRKKVPKNLIYYVLFNTYYPIITFLKLYIRHLGFLDGYRGFLWSFFSALHFPIAYYKYWKLRKD
jgi:glycosyltransferase involved in cell wall biosynthesis